MANWQVQSERQMKRGETDLSEVVTALLSFHFYPLSALLFLLLSASSSLSSLHLYALFPLFNSVLSPLSFNLPVMFPLLFSSLLFSSLLFYFILFYSILFIPSLSCVLFSGYAAAGWGCVSTRCLLLSIVGLPKPFGSPVAP